MIRLGRWQEVLSDVECDAVICDPPYSARVHACDVGSRADGSDAAGLTPAYSGWSLLDVREFFDHWSPRCRGWIAALTDSDLASVFRAEADRVGRLSFAPVPCVMRGMSVRMMGDGPSSWSVSLMVSRPRTAEMKAWGTLPGAYSGTPGRESGGGRGKPDWLMRAIVADYSRVGDLVVDPFAGWGATLSAALGMDRKAIGAEMDADARDEALRRLGRGQQRDLFASLGGAA